MFVTDVTQQMLQYMLMLHTAAQQRAGLGAVTCGEQLLYDESEDL
jgi:hypothetical protein